MFGGGSEAKGPPKLSAIQISDMGYGAVVQICYGANRVSPMLGWTANFQAHEHKNSGGKGGGGGGSSYTYSSDIMFFFCEGPILKFGKLWVDKKVYATPFSKPFGYYQNGDATETPWPYLQSKYPDQALAYRGVALMTASNYALKDGAALGNHSAEVYGRFLGAPGDVNELDCYPRGVIGDFLNNEQYGVIDTNATPLIVDLNDLHDYTVARGILISPLLNEARAAVDWLSDWAKICNCAPVWSEGRLKFKPYADASFSGNGATYTPDTAIRFEFNDDNVSEPIKPARKKSQDCFNKLTVEYLRRKADYNKHTVEVKDDVAIADEGLRPAEKLKLEAIKSANVAMIVAHTELLRGLYIRNTYTINTFCMADVDLLEPLDFITITDPALGLDRFRARIVSIDDTQEGYITITAEEAPNGVYYG